MAGASCSGHAGYVCRTREPRIRRRAVGPHFDKLYIREGHLAVILHTSISAAEPELVARAIATIWQGGVAPAPKPLFPGSWLAFGRDERGSVIEVHPLDFAFVLRSKANEIEEHDPKHRARVGWTAVHFAIASPLTEREIHDIAQRTGWESGTDQRIVPGGGYGVVEVWVENRQMLEVLTPEMQAQYARTMRRIPDVIPPVVP